MLVEIVRLLLDFGLLILIWMVQRIIYPSFLFLNDAKSFIHWHNKYMKTIASIVAPLMVGQLIIVMIQIVRAQNFYTIVSFIIVLILWIFTFIVFVPLHSKISQGTYTIATLKKLVLKNWMRTILWTVLAIYSILQYHYLS